MHASAYLHYGAGNFIFDQPWDSTRNGTVDRFYFHRGRLLTVERLAEGHTAIHAWHGATFTVIEASREIFVEERPLTLITSMGPTTRECVEALHGDFAHRRLEPGTRWR